MTIEQNGTLAKQNGIVLFLDAPFEDCYHRIAGDSNRPNAHSAPRKNYWNYTKHVIHSIKKIPVIRLMPLIPL